jgi:hypothetical protein
MRSSAAYGAIGQLVRGALGVPRAGSPEERQARVREGVARVIEGPEAAGVAFFLGELIGEHLPDDGDPARVAARHSPATLAGEVKRALAEYMRAEARRAPVVIALDDLQWCDAPSVKLVGGLLFDLGAEPLFVIALGRPLADEAAHETARWPRTEAIRLATLAPRAAGTLVRNALGERATPEVTARILERANGNAFFLEELIRSVADGRERPPESVLAVAAARLDELPAQARRVLRAASVFGETARRDGIEALLEGALAPAELATTLGLLVDAEVLQRRVAAGREELFFRHALLRDAAYASLTTHDRQVGHGLAGAWLEKIGEAEPLIIGTHYELAGDPRSVPHLHAAAIRAWGATDLVGAAAIAERGIAAGASGADLGHLLAAQAEAYTWMGNAAPAIALGLRALEHIPRGDPTALLVSSYILYSIPAAPDPRALVTVFARSAAEPIPDEMTYDVARACWGLIVTPAMHGRRDISSGILDRLEPHWRRADEHDRGTAGWLHQGFCCKGYFVDGNLWQMHVDSVAGNRAFRSINDPLGQFPTGLGCCTSLVELGAHDEALVYGGRVLGASGGDEVNLWKAWTEMAYGVMHRRRGELGAARAVLDSCIQRSQRDPVGAALGRAELALVLLDSGDPTGALAEADQGASLIAMMPYLSGHPRVAQARALLALGRVAEAVPIAEGAYQDLVKMGTQATVETICRLTWVEALEASGDPRAPAAAAEAKARLLERAGQIADERHRSGFLGVPESRWTLAAAERLGG